MKTMKIKLAVLSLVAIGLGTGLFAQKEALVYMDNISKELKDIQTDTWDYTSAAAHGKSARKVENRRKDILRSNMDAQKKIGSMKAFDGSTVYRDSVLAYLKMSHTVLNHDYGKLVDMEEIAEQSYDGMEAYLLAQDKANDKLDAAGDMLESEQKKFAAANNINLLDNKDKTTQKLESAGKVYAYYNVLYLIFFKSYKQELYVLDAMAKADVSAMNQNISSLAKFSEEGLKKLDTMKAFKGDHSIRLSCKEVLEFYKNEATVKLPSITGFYVKKEKFDKIKAAFDAKPQNKRTQADVDEFNTGVNEYNTASNDFNKVNQELNNNRNNLIEKWNKSVGNFTNKHVPKYK
jgi:hypothetical protein